MNYWKKLGIPAVVAIRLILPLFLWRNVLVVWALIFLVDCFDGEVFRRAFSHRKNSVYQLFDKILDFYGYCFALAFSFSSAASIFNVLLFFFLLRAVGMGIFLIKRERRVFLFFPNIFEDLFILYIISLSFSSFSFLLEGGCFYVALLVLVVLKTVREYLSHIKKLSFYELLTGKRWV